MGTCGHVDMGTCGHVDMGTWGHVEMRTRGHRVCEGSDYVIFFLFVFLFKIFQV